MKTSFQKILNDFPSAFCLLNEEGILLETNYSFLSLTGLTKDNIIGKPFSFCFKEENKNDIDELIKLNSLVEKKITLLNNEVKHFEFSSSSFYDGKNSRLTLLMIKDISDKKKFIDDLYKSEQRYKELFNNTNDAVFVCYINYGKTLSNFVEVNNVACKRLGYSKEELLDTNPGSVVFGNFEGEVGNIIDRLFSEGQVIFEVVHLTKNEEKIPAEISAHLFNYNERPALIAISRDLTERQRVENQLLLTTEQLRNLASRLQLIREEERTVIAREIHDELGQALTVLKIQVSLLAKKLEENQTQLKDKTLSISQLLDQTITSVQKITTKLRPGILDELGLVAAIEWQTQDFEQRTNIVCDVNLLKEEISLDQEISTAVFRIFQEALTNVARHANASKVKIQLTEFKNTLILEVTDNGKGITQSQVNNPQSLGLLGIKERVLLFGGKVEIKSSMKSGTTVKVEIPFNNINKKDNVK